MGQIQSLIMFLFSDLRSTLANTLPITDLLCLKNWGTQCTLFKFFKILVIYCSAVFPPDLALILLEYTQIIGKFQISRRIFEKTQKLPIRDFFYEFCIINIKKQIDFKNNRCKYVRILQSLRKSFQYSQKYGQKGCFSILFSDVRKNLFYD